MGSRLSVIVVLYMALWGCGDREIPPAIEIPGLDATETEHLAIPSSPACAVYLASASTDRLIALHDLLLDARFAEPESESAATAERALEAVDGVLANDRGLDTYAEESRYLTDLPIPVSQRIIFRRNEAASVFAGSEKSISEKLTLITQLHDASVDEDPIGVIETCRYLGVLEHRRGEPRRAADWLRRAIHLARQSDRLRDECDSYGQSMMMAMHLGWSPAQRDTLQHLIDKARSAGLAKRTSHLISLQAYDAFDQGRLFTARTTFEDAIETCRHLGDPSAALATMIVLARMYATLDCWDQVGTLLERIHLLLKESRDSNEPMIKQILWEVQARSLEGRRLAASHRNDDAHEVFDATFAVACELPYEEASFVGWQWIESMIDQNRPDLAAEALVTLESYARSKDMRVITRRVPYWRAWLAWNRGDMLVAAAELKTFGGLMADGVPIARDLRFQYFALLARVQAHSDIDAAAGTLLEGWRALQEKLLEQESGTEAYLDLNRNLHLRWAAHDILGVDPDLGYGLELLWRNAMLARATSLTDVSTLADAARVHAAAAHRILDLTGATHCLYQIRQDYVTRWTADSDTTSVDSLRVPVAELRTRTESLLAELATDPGHRDAATPPLLQTNLAAMAQIVLPECFSQPRSVPTTLFLASDGFLSQLPFAALNLSVDGNYRPLVETTDVEWRRHGLASIVAVGSETVQAIGDPVLNDATCRRFSLAPRLPGASDELLRVAGLLPTDGVLEGAEATVGRARAVWDNAEILYIVGHVVTDPQVPFASWLPLSAGDSSSPYPGMGVQDVLSHRFRRCRIAVLSGCSTGMPYVDGLIVVPSLGDAFLDAGVGASIQTLWPVRDRQSLVHPERILAAWRNNGRSIAAALADEQRRGLTGPNGTRHPFYWAVWTAKSSGK